MFTCKPARKSIVFIYLLLIAIAVGLTYLVKYFDSFLHSAADIIIAVLWILTAVYLVVLMPLYYKRTLITVSEDKITKYTFMFTYKYQYMSMGSVKSVTTLVLPLGSLTGLNCIIINALGARLLLPFLNKKDCIEITRFFNDTISSRSKS